MVTTDPVAWGANWPHQFDSYRRTVDIVETQYGGSSAMPARILAESIDYSRQAQASAVRLRAPEAPTIVRPVEPVQGMTPTEKAPPAPRAR